ncbi:uncharacterized protein LOC101901578 [Musca domestica]|uniref:Uncharacterized protein LOC101901578 n=1 Tax=Musca domestica TaxID=7370 RepID=A0A1I8N3K1_MUSDO|nr:uncharacterized protein LOC101901578 [Musca domestica]
MKLFVAAIFGLLAFASGDVSHLLNTYLPPFQQKYPAPSNQYLPPVHNTYSGPALQSFSSYSVRQPENIYSAPAVQSFSSYSAPTVRRHQQYFSAPSVEYLPPVHTSYLAPATFHQQSFSTGSGSYSSVGADIGTQYAANGGYVYRKK